MFRSLRKTIKQTKKYNQKAQFYERIFLLKGYINIENENKEHFDCKFSPTY